jgi:hypothetical protein
MKASDIFRENAENSADLAAAEPSKDTPAYRRYKRMEAAWRALAEEQDWLDGEVPPVRIARSESPKTPSGKKPARRA